MVRNGNTAAKGSEVKKIEVGNTLRWNLFGSWIKGVVTATPESEPTLLTGEVKVYIADVDKFEYLIPSLLEQLEVISESR